MAEQPEDDHPGGEVVPLRAAAPVVLEGQVVGDAPRRGRSARSRPCG